MKNLLIAESGSTKTDWCYINKLGKKQTFKTSGINPFLQTAPEILTELQDQIKWDADKKPIDALFYYGAGSSNSEKKKGLAKLLKQHFKANKITVDGDLLAAARGICGTEKGMISILGTGSNCAYFDGKKLHSTQPSLGFIAGDEGSGNHIGKRILQYYAYHTFDEELKTSFELHIGSNMNEIIDKIYKNPFPNRYLASFAPLLALHRGHFMVENILEDCFYEFFNNHILKYKESWRFPLHFTGSIAYIFRDVLQNLCHQYELNLGKVVKSPMTGLIDFHQSQ